MFLPSKSNLPFTACLIRRNALQEECKESARAVFFSEPHHVVFVSVRVCALLRDLTAPLAQKCCASLHCCCFPFLFILSLNEAVECMCYEGVWMVQDVKKSLPMLLCELLVWQAKFREKELDNKPACARAMLLSCKQWALLSLLSPFTYWSPMINCLLLLRSTMQRPLHYGPSSCSGHEYTDDDADDDDPWRCTCAVLMIPIHFQFLFSV